MDDPARHLLEIMPDGTTRPAPIPRDEVADAIDRAAERIERAIERHALTTAIAIYETGLWPKEIAEQADGDSAQMARNAWNATAMKESSDEHLPA